MTARLGVALAERPRLRGGLVALAGVTLGLLTGALVALGPVWLGFAALVALAGGYAILRSTAAGQAAVVAVITLLPFGTLPFKAAVTPSFLELTLLALLVVWVLRLLVRPEFDLRMAALGGPILGWLGLTVFSLLLGANGLPDNLTLHNYLKFVLSVLLFFSVLNTARSRGQLRWLLGLVIVGGGVAALVGIALRQLGDGTALRLLVSLGRLGYPTSGRVLRFIADDPGGIERAIGTSVDPNSFGGLLALIGAATVSQLFVARPVLPRPAIWAAAGLIAGATFLTYSRGALLGLVAGVLFLAVFGDRRLWWLLLASAVLAVVGYLAFGIGEAFVKRLVEGVQFQDQAQLMRLAEFNNAIAIIKRYPVFGVGFGSGPELGLITGVSSIYLAMAERLGLVGLGVFALIIAAFFIITLRRLRHLDPERRAWALATQAGVVAALVVGLGDHYFLTSSSRTWWRCSGACSRSAWPWCAMTRRCCQAPIS